MLRGNPSPLWRVPWHIRTRPRPPEWMNFAAAATVSLACSARGHDVAHRHHLRARNPEHVAQQKRAAVAHRDLQRLAFGPGRQPRRRGGHDGRRFQKIAAGERFHWRLLLRYGNPFTRCGAGRHAGPPRRGQFLSGRMITSNGAPPPTASTATIVRTAPDQVGRRPVSIAIVLVPATATLAWYICTGTVR